MSAFGPLDGLIIAICFIPSGFAYQLVSGYPAIEASRTSWPKQPAKICESTNKKININQATSEELQTLPGIGPAIAQRILEYRRKNPPFRKVEELLIIRGISPDRLQRMKGRISVE
jgi:competence ComEA-like helix-hairpin-helix protein